MEAEGLEQKVSWLDEQRRRDLSVLEAIQQRLVELEGQIQSQREQGKDVTDDLSRLNTLATRIEEFDDSLHKHRQEVSRQLKAQSELREERDKNLEEIRQADRDAISGRIAELKEQVQSVSSLEEAIENRKEEELRQSKELDALEKQVDDLIERTEDQRRQIIALEDARNSESQRIAQVQSDVSSVRQQVETLKGSNDLVEDRLRRIETQISELETSESEQNKAMEAWRENQSRKIVDFERQWSEWEERFSSFEKMASDLDERMIQYEETYRNTRQLQNELEKVVDRLERRINEVTEIQRLAEDRQKQEWRSFVADDKKRWNTYKLTSEEQWREHDRLHKRMDDQLEKLDAASAKAIAQLEELQAGTDKRLRDLLDLARQWLQDEEAS